MATKDPERRKEHNRTYYNKNKEVVYNRNLARKAAIIAYIQAIKEDTPCMDCEIIYPSYVMHFDHVRGIKKGNIAEAVQRGWSLKKLQEEIDKCELVCCNCHSVRTYNRAHTDLA